MRQRLSRRRDPRPPHLQPLWWMIAGVCQGETVGERHAGVRRCPAVPRGFCPGLAAHDEIASDLSCARPLYGELVGPGGPSILAFGPIRALVNRQHFNLPVPGGVGRAFL